MDDRLESERKFVAGREAADAHVRELLDGLQERRYDDVAAFLCDHPDVPPAVVGLTVGRVFLTQYRICYPKDFERAARDTFDLILKDAENLSR